MPAISLGNRRPKTGVGVFANPAGFVIYSHADQTAADYSAAVLFREGSWAVFWPPLLKRRQREGLMRSTRVKVLVNAAWSEKPESNAISTRDCLVSASRY